MKLTYQDFDYLSFECSAWAGSSLCELDAFSSADRSSPIRKDLLTIFWFESYAEILWARQYLEQEGIDYQVLMPEGWPDDKSANWCITANIAFP